MRQRWHVFVVLAAVLMPACAEPLFRVGQHEIQLAEDKVADVVWMVRGKTLQRCSAETGSPVCTPASGIEIPDPTEAAGLAQHTIKVAEHRQVDVVWILVAKGMYRCDAPRGAPVCTRVREGGGK